MALPSSLYAEDTNARTTLANGTVLKWSKKFNEIYGFGSETDLSITYCEWNSMNLTYARKTPNVWYNSCDAGLPDLGVNESGYPNDTAAGWTRTDGMSPKVDGIFSGVILTSPNSGKFYWGYDPMGSSTVAEGGGQDTRILLDMDINKMLFSVTFTAVILADLPNGNTAYSADPTGQHFPDTVTITLKELYDNPDKYGILDYNFGNCLVYGENTSDHWRTASIKPSFLLYKPNEMAGYLGTSPMGNCSGSIKMSFDPRYSNSHPTVSGGSLGAPIYQYGKSDNAYHYNIHFPTEFELKPNSNSYDLLGKDAILYYQQVYGSSTAGNHSVYVTANTIEVDDSIFWGVAEVGVSQTINPLVDKYTMLKWNWRHMYKGRYMLAYIAAFGLYFVNETYDPDDDNITPETLGDSGKIWLGEMSGNGMTTGNWITDLDSYHGPNKEGKTSNPSYKPSGGGGSGDGGGDNETDMPLHDYMTNAGMVNYYLVDRHTAQRVSDAISEINWQTIGRDLLPNMISYKIFAAGSAIAGASRQISIGGVALEEQGQPVKGQPVSGFYSVSLGSIAIPETFHDFRDYAPYTKIEVYVPCCGWAQLPPWCMGKTISGELFIDLPNGSCKAVLKSSLTVVAELGGSCSVDVPFTATANGVKTANIISNIASGMTAAYNPTPQNIMSSAMGLLSAFNSNYTNIKGVNGDGSNLDGLWNVFVKVTRPASIDDEGKDLRPVTSTYLHDRGRPCGKHLTITAGDGYTQVIDANISGTMTAAEKQMIIDGFRHGLIISATPT